MGEPTSIGGYEVLGEVARGGMGVVYRALDPTAGREVAIKLLLAGKGANAGQRSRFAREARTLARLQHPNVMPIHDAGEHQGAPYLVMPLLEGRTLQERLNREGPLSPIEAARIVRQVAGAVAHCHQAGVLHRDLKPENVLSLEGGVPVLTDFGLARDMDLSLSGTQLSVDGQFLGTPGYWAPEQARGELRLVGPHSDVYGLGALLFALLTGRAPYVGQSLVDILAQVSSPVLAPSKLRNGIPAGLERACLRCLALDPSRRFPSAASVAEALADYEELSAIPRGGLLVAGGAAALLFLAAALTLGGSDPVPAATGLTSTAPTSSSAPVVPKLAQAKPLESLSAVALAAEGKRRYEAGDFDGAKQAIDRALVKDPEQRRGLLLRARLLTHWNDYAEAAAIAHGVPDSYSDPEALEILVLAYSQIELFDRARTAADRLVSLDPQDGERLLVRAGMNLERKDLLAARKDIDRALAMLEGRAQGRALGFQSRLLFLVSQGLEGKSSEAEAARQQARYVAERALELDPASSEARWTLIQITFLNRDWEGCQEVLDEVIADRPRDPELRLRRAWLRAWAQDVAGSLADCDKAIELWPGFPVALAQRGSLYTVLYGQSRQAGAAAEAAERLARAKADMAEAVTNGPRCALVHRTNANLQRILGDPQAEVAAYDRALLVLPHSKELLRLRAAARHERAEDLDGAVVDYRRALELEPEHPPTLHQLALTLVELDRYREALEAERVAWRRSKKPVHQLWAAICRYELGKSSQARKEILVAMKTLRAEHMPVGFLYLGHASWALKLEKEAVAAYRAYLKDPGEFGKQKSLVEERVAEIEGR